MRISAQEPNLMQQNIQDNLQLMRHALDKDEGMDIVIISTSCPKQAAYWQQRLEETRGTVCSRHAEIIVIHEDWPGGAGNALGTFYAFQKASEQSGIDLLERQAEGAALAIYHTAGKGTRLAPLAGSEGNNKSGVKLPGLLESSTETRVMTILEAVIKQTGIYASSRKGRLSVFWGDQIFVPSTPLPYTADHEADILARIGPSPTAQDWEEHRLQSYGILAIDQKGHAQQIEKIDFQSYRQLREEKKLHADGGLGISLGSFSLSSLLLSELLALFSEELKKRAGKLDSDPHLWMPLTLDLDTYREVMKRKGCSPQWSEAHWNRMQCLKDKLGAKLLGVVDIGIDSYWWDYGQIRHYQNNVLKMTGIGDESSAMRRFFNCERPTHFLEAPISIQMDGSSRMLRCEIGEGSIRNSILVGVTADKVEVEDSILIDTVAPSIRCKDCLLYNVIDEDPIALEEHTVRADVVMPDKRHLSFYTKRDRDGSADWSQVIAPNALSYEELHQLNSEIDSQLSVEAAKELKAALKKRLSERES